MILYKRHPTALLNLLLDWYSHCFISHIPPGKQLSYSFVSPPRSDNTSLTYGWFQSTDRAPYLNINRGGNLPAPSWRATNLSLWWIWQVSWAPTFPPASQNTWVGRQQEPQHMHAACCLDGCIINAKLEVFHAGFYNFGWVGPSLKAIQNPDIGVNGSVWKFVMLPSVTPRTSVNSYIFSAYICKSLGANSGLTGSFELIFICLCKEA